MLRINVKLGISFFWDPVAYIQKICKQPIKETYLLKDELEKTNEPYAIAKIAGIKMCESYNFQYKTNYRCLMPKYICLKNFFPSIKEKLK